MAAQENQFLATSFLETTWLHSSLGWSLCVLQGQGKAILNKTEETCPPGWMGLSDPIIEAIKQEKRHAEKTRRERLI